MSQDDLASLYRAYISCLNDRDLDRLADHVDRHVEYNGRGVGIAGYREMLEANYRDIHDLAFHVQDLVVNATMVASRLSFSCHPVDGFLGLRISGRRVAFGEHAFYEYGHGRIRRVWSIIDKAGIESQIPRMGD